MAPSALGPRAFEEAIASSATGRYTHTTLVSVFAPGGWDALSLLYPTGDPLYRRLRPEIAFKPGDGPVFESDDRLHWHPQLEPFAKLHGQGWMVFLAIGYTHPDQSHFVLAPPPGVRVRSIHSSRPSPGARARRDRQRQQRDAGLRLDPTLLPSLATAKMPVATLQNPSDYGFDSRTSGTCRGHRFPTRSARWAG